MNKNNLLFSFNKTTSPVAYCILSIGLGTRNENPKYNGLAHLTEHMLFKGTPQRKSVEISNTLEKVGGDMNAFTTKERIVVYTTTLKEDIKKALELIFNVCFASSFYASELKKEKVVVYDEIITYQDSPIELLFDTFENELFASTPLGYSILGEKKSLDRITPSILKQYQKRFFVPSNMTLAIAGDFDEDKLISMINIEIKKYHKSANLLKVTSRAKIQKEQIPFTSKEFILSRYNTKNELSKGSIFEKSVDKKLKQAHCILGTSAYSFYNTHKRQVLSLITNMLGGPASNSRLSMSLREKHALVYNVEAQYVAYKDTGCFSIYFGCEKKYLDKCLKLIKKEIEKLISKELSIRALNAAKKQMLGQISIASDNIEAKTLAMGKSLLLSGKEYDQMQLREELEKITTKEVQQVAKEILSWNRLSRLIFY